MTHHLYRTTALALTASTLLATLPAGAADMIFTPSTGSGVVVESTPGTPALRVQPTGAVQLPLLPGSTPANGTPVCHDAGGATPAPSPAPQAPRETQVWMASTAHRVLPVKTLC